MLKKFIRSMTLAQNICLVVMIVAMAACHKSDEGPSLVVQITQISNGQRLLTWNEIAGAETYKVWRSVKKGSTYPDATLLATVDFLTLQYLDESVPLSAGIQYYISASVSNREIKSNVITSSGSTEINMNPYQMKLLPDKNLAIVRDYSEMIVLDYDQRVVIKRRTFPGKIGGFDLGTFNGKKELYVPSTDHNVYIMDPTDLSMIDTLVTNFSVESVAVNSKGLIFLSCSQQFTPLKIFNRAGLAYVSQHPGESDSKIILQSDNKLLAVSTHISPPTMSYYVFDDQGTLVTKNDDPYGYDYEMDAESVKMSSKYIVTSAKTCVYTADKQMTLIAKLTPNNGTAVDFEFSDDETVIHVASPTTNGIMRYSASGATMTTLPTSGFPWVITRNGSEMIVLGAPASSLPNFRNGKTTLERISLK